MVTPEQARRWCHRYGGMRPAARALGVPDSTLRNYLNPEPARERMRGEAVRERVRKRYWENPEPARERMRDYYHSLPWVKRHEYQLKNGIKRRQRRIRERRERSGTL
jgi:hypothetical protein